MPCPRRRGLAVGQRRGRVELEWRRGLVVEQMRGRVERSVV